MPETRDAAGRFLPGNPGSPGRPKGAKSLTDALRRQLAQIPTAQAVEVLCRVYEIPADMRLDLELSEDTEELFAKLLTWRAIRGDLEAWREIGDRLSPKPKRLEVSGREGAPIQTVSAEMSPDQAARLYHEALDPVSDT